MRGTIALHYYVLYIVVLYGVVLYGVVLYGVVHIALGTPIFVILASGPLVWSLVYAVVWCGVVCMLDLGIWPWSGVLLPLVFVTENHQFSGKGNVLMRRRCREGYNHHQCKVSGSGLVVDSGLCRKF